ncbi:MAG TPA: hypothetical protein VFL88_04635, partial [Gemmatimonadales bacterium]|nr:hypothetical protein [Gemmatimonadales bacterium]
GHHAERAHRPDRNRVPPARGRRTAGELVRIADHLHVEVDEDGYVAGFWLTGVPAFPDFEEG